MFGHPRAEKRARRTAGGEASGLLYFIRTAPDYLDARSPYSRRLYALGTDGLDASKTGNRRRVPKGVYYNVHNRGQGARSPYYDADKPSGLFEGVLPIKIRVLDNVGFTKLDHVAH